MARKTPQIQIQEIGGDQYPRLEAAQASALDDLSLHLAQTLRDLLASGRLVQVNGKIIPNQNR